MNCNMKRACKGQAIVELCAAMVVIMLLLSALLIVVRMGRAHTKCAWEARANAGNAVLGDSLMTEALLPQSPADSTPISDLAHWDSLIRSTAQNPLVGDNSAMYALYHDSVDETTDFSDVPFVGHYILGRDEMEVQSDAYMVWTRGIY